MGIVVAFAAGICTPKALPIVSLYPVSGVWWLYRYVQEHAGTLIENSQVPSPIFPKYGNGRLVLLLASAIPVLLPWEATASIAAYMNRNASIPLWLDAYV